MTERHTVSISKVKNKWHVPTVEARQGEEIRWTVQEKKAHLQFMDQSLFGEWTESVSPTEPLTLEVGNVDPDTYHYAVFCTADEEYAEGDTPPKIIIKR